MDALSPHEAEVFWDYGTYAFALGALVFAAVSVGLAVAAFSSDRARRELKKDLARTRDLHAKIDSTLIVTSHLALAGLPKITFTQQIPRDLMNTVSIIDNIFKGGHGAALWRSISEQPELAHLAYARAVYKFGLDPLSRKDLMDGEDSVLALLNAAFDAARHSERDPISLRRDILVRKCQVLRQVERFEESMLAARDLDDLNRRYKDMATRHLEAWCLALVYLQQGVTLTTLAQRRTAFANARERLSDSFVALFGKPGASPAPESSSRRLPDVEPRSIAYYTAKSHICYRLLQDDAARQDEADTKTLAHSIDLALTFYQTALANDVLDPLVSCSYNLCIAFLIVAARETLPQGTELTEFTKTFGRTWDDFDLHAAGCLKECAQSFKDEQRAERRSKPKFIYSECAERLVGLDDFQHDIELLQRAIKSPNVLRDFYRDCRKGWR